MGYDVVDEEDVPWTDLSEDDSVLPTMRVKILSDVLDTQKSNVRLWEFKPGDEIGYHAHAEQEELYYIVEGEFSLKLGPSGKEEYIEVGPGTFYVAGSETGHGHRCIGDNPGRVLAVGVPPVDDPGLDPHSL